MSAVLEVRREGLRADDTEEAEVVVADAIERVADKGVIGP
jgi:hypothetical protein